MSRRGAAVVVLAACTMAPAAGAQVPVGPEFRVNSTTYGDQFSTRAGSVASDANGQFVVVWYSIALNGTGGLFGQRYNAAGAPQGAEFQAASLPVTGPSVAMGSTGGFIITWARWSADSSNETDVIARRFDASGMPQGSEFRVNSYTTNRQEKPSIASDAGGNFVVVWMSHTQDGSGWGVFGQRYDAAGALQGAEFRVNVITTAGDQGHPRVAASGDGRFGVVWRAGSGQDSDVFAEFWDSSGLPSGDLMVNSHTTGSQYEPAIAADSNGNFIVVWQSYEQDGSDWGVFGRRFTASGNALGSEFAVNSYTTNTQRWPAVSASADGFIVVWDGLSENDDGAGSTDVFGQRYDASGVAQGASFQINKYTTGWQSGASIASDANGSFVVAWGSYLQDGDRYGVFGQRLGPDLIFKDGFDSLIIF